MKRLFWILTLALPLLACGEIESMQEFEVGGDNYNDSRIDSGKFTDK